MNQLTTYQKYIIKRYLLIIFISFLRTFYLNYNIFKKSIFHIAKYSEYGIIFYIAWNTF